MANSRRIEKFAALIKREVSDLLINGVRDDRIHQSMTTITAVDVSGDLQHCKIYVSIFGQQEKNSEVLSCLVDSRGFIRAELAKRLQMRRVPEIEFKIDNGMIKGVNVLNILDDLETKRQAKINK